MPAWWHMLFLISSGLWLGSLIFFSFLVAPTVFHALDLPNAAKFMRVMFPRYYTFQTILTVALTGLLAFASSGAAIDGVFYGGRAAVFPVLVGFVCSTLGRRWLTPNVNEARDARAAAAPESPEFAEAQARFSKYHRISVQVNLAAMVAALTFNGPLFDGSRRDGGRTAGHRAAVSSAPAATRVRLFRAFDFPRPVWFTRASNPSLPWGSAALTRLTEGG